jgi:type II secretion system protein G
MLHRKREEGFTLIELLIVVAIIAILAAIAVPNFLEAQVRSKISRAKADMRTIAVAIESYAVDNNRGPIGGNEGNFLNIWDEFTRHYCYNRFTTPIAYLTSVPLDPFADKIEVYNPMQDEMKKIRHYQYQHMLYQTTRNNPENRAMAQAYWAGYVWYLRSVGPDKMVGQPYFAGMASPLDWSNHAPPNGVYDPTNGTMSWGDIYLSNKGFFTGSN